MIANLINQLPISIRVLVLSNEREINLTENNVFSFFRATRRDGHTKNKVNLRHEGVLTSADDKGVKEDFQCSICFQNLKEIEDSWDPKVYKLLLRLPRSSHHQFLFMCPYSINNKHKYTHGMCIDCSLSLYMQHCSSTDSKTEMPCPMCRKSIEASNLKRFLKNLPGLSTLDLLPEILLNFVLHLPVQWLFAFGLSKLFGQSRKHRTAKVHVTSMKRRFLLVILSVIVLTSTFLGMQMGMHVSNSLYDLFGMSLFAQYLPRRYRLYPRLILKLIITSLYSTFSPYFLITKSRGEGEEMMKQFIYDGFQALLLDLSHYRLKSNLKHNLNQTYSNFIEQRYQQNLAKERPKHMFLWILLFCAIGRYYRVRHRKTKPTGFGKLYAFLGPGIIISTIHSLLYTAFRNR
mmetsp:Transcript_13726/g.20796  ORF Transcript_13726/g.20796 Transcript_13726/m.20796 type:complete len:404 (+) Transcript_13726:132-1343(+)